MQPTMLGDLAAAGDIQCAAAGVADVDGAACVVPLRVGSNHRDFARRAGVEADVAESGSLYCFRRRSPVCRC